MINKENIYIYNWQQACFYIQNGLNPIESPGFNKKSGNIYFIFERKATKPLFDMWCKRKENDSEQ